MNVPAQLVLQNYFHERLMERIAHSKYKRNFVFKGGYLIGAIVGLSARTTMDLDATIVSFTLNADTVKKMFEEIASVESDDGILFTVLNIAPIRINEFYNGFRISLLSEFEHLKTPISLDLTLGDSIHPTKREFSFPMMFETGMINVFSYSSETIIAEKLQTTLSRGIQNTRMRDFYDLHILWTRVNELIDLSVLPEAVTRTFAHRRTPNLLNEALAITDEISKNTVMQQQWEAYRQTYAYAQTWLFEDVIKSIRDLISVLLKSKV